MCVKEKEAIERILRKRRTEAPQEADGAKASKKDPAAPGLGIGDTPQSGGAFALEPERIQTRSEAKAKASTKDPAAPGLGIGDTSQSGEAFALEPERIKRKSEGEAGASP